MEEKNGNVGWRFAVGLAASSLACQKWPKTSGRCPFFPSSAHATIRSCEMDATISNLTNDERLISCLNCAMWSWCDRGWWCRDCRIGTEFFGPFAACDAEQNSESNDSWCSVISMSFERGFSALRHSQGNYLRSAIKVKSFCEKIHSVANVLGNYSEEINDFAFVVNVLCFVSFKYTR